ncbi:unnamed protein product, partial [Ectocarpus sp. 4 AP-2014]
MTSPEGLRHANITSHSAVVCVKQHITYYSSAHVSQSRHQLELKTTRQHGGSSNRGHCTAESRPGHILHQRTPWWSGPPHWYTQSLAGTLLPNGPAALRNVHKPGHHRSQSYMSSRDKISHAGT